MIQEIDILSSDLRKVVEFESTCFKKVNFHNYFIGHVQIKWPSLSILPILSTFSVSPSTWEHRCFPSIWPITNPEASPKPCIRMLCAIRNMLYEKLLKLNSVDSRNCYLILWPEKSCWIWKYLFQESQFSRTISSDMFRYICQACQFCQFPQLFLFHLPHGSIDVSQASGLSLTQKPALSHV